MAFITYENHRNPHITIHLDGCSQIAKRGGQHKHGQGGYQLHDNYSMARSYAESTGLSNIIDCSFCINREPPAVRILPLDFAEFPGCRTIPDVQQRFFLDDLPSREAGLFRYRKRGLKAEAGTAVLFQCESRIIASAVFQRAVPFAHRDAEGFEGGLSFDVRTIHVFDPIDAEGLRRIWPTFTSFSHVRQSLDPPSLFSAFVRGLTGIASPQGRLTAEEAVDELFEPEDGDSRPLADRQIRERRGQTAFREALRQRYGDRCMVTGCTILAMLEASHIKPYRGQSDNHQQNGLLLRSDIHTLFDLDLLGIEPNTLKVELHPDVTAEYGSLAGQTLRCTEDKGPSQEELRRRYQTFRTRLQGPA
jgi:hypothetical protein